MQLDIPFEVRQRIRQGKHSKNTSGLAQGFVQGNLVILTREIANDFLRFCQLNPKPCPVIGMSRQAGDYNLPDLGRDIDIRYDVPKYRIYEYGSLIKEVSELKNLWQDDFVTFILGCSFSFEEALIADGLEIRNITENVNVPMYRTNIPCKPAGQFSANMVVSMRPMKAADAIRAVQICSRFPSVHGAPVHLGNPELIGIKDIHSPDFGDRVTIKADELPVFWACGVTPQVAIEQATPPFCITHSPGHMLITDLANSHLAIM